MKKILAITLVLMLTLCFLPGIAAFGANVDGAGLVNSYPYAKQSGPPIDDGDDLTPESPGPMHIGAAPGEAEKIEVEPFIEPPWKLVPGHDADGDTTVAAVNYVAPDSDDGVYQYDPGCWLLEQMLGKLDEADAQYRYLELTAGSFKPLTVPALVPYEGAEAGESVYSALFRLPSQEEGRVFPDDNIELVLNFPGGITVRIPGQDTSQSISDVKLDVYGDRLIVELVGAEDAQAYVELSGSGTPLWIDAEGNELEAEYEYDEASGVYKIAVKSGLALVFKA